MADYLSWLHTLEIGWILWVQSFHWLDAPMLFFSLLGSQFFFLVFFPAIYWSIDNRFGYQFGLILILSGMLNSLLKIGFHLPRPFWVDLRIRTYLYEDTFGLPSGHAQIAVAIWGLFGVVLRKRWIWLLLLGVIFLIGFSRIYLGVHFPSDVLLGFWIGAILLFAFLTYGPAIRDRLEGRSDLFAFGVFFIVGIGVLFCGILVLNLILDSGWVLPLEWIENAQKAFPGKDQINPLRLDELIISCGAFLGFASGGFWLKRHRKIGVEGSLFHRILRFLVGAACVIFLYFGWTFVFPVETSSTGILTRFILFTLIGVWISAGAPLLFVRLGIAKVADG